MFRFDTRLHAMARCLALGLLLADDVVGAAVIHVDRDEVLVAANARYSLIEAIANAEADAQIHSDCARGSGADVIRLSPAADYVFGQPITPGSDTAMPLIASELTIDGRGSTISRLDRWHVEPFRFMATLEADLTLRNLTFQGGRLTTQYAFDGGAVLWQRGGSLVTENVRFVDNEVSPNGRGGAIYISAGGSVQAPMPRTLIEDCVFENNVVDAISGQQSVGGGAIWIETGELEIDRCAFSGNRTQSVAVPQAGGGGALHISDHGADSDNVQDGFASRVWVRNTTFSDNRAGMSGAINMQSSQGFFLSLQLSKVTLVDNSAFGPVKGIGANAGV